MYTRIDISLEERLEIFSLFWRYQDDYGWATELSRRFNTSRQFIYQLAERVRQAVDWQRPGRKAEDRGEAQLEQFQQKVWKLESECDQLRSQLEIERQQQQERRMELLLELALCPVSEDKIARCLKAAFGSGASSGWINEQINRAGQAALALMQRAEVKEALKEAALDEMFNHGQPILTIVDPHTLMMVVPEMTKNRQGETWHNVLEQYPHLELAVSDQGSGLRKGLKLNGEINHQADLFHFKRNLRREVNKLEIGCYRAIEQVEQARKLIDNPRLLDSARIQAKVEYQQKVVALDCRLAAFDWMELIVNYLAEHISVFDFRHQCLRTYETAQAVICEALDLLAKIDEFDLKPIIGLIEGVRGTLFQFLNVLEGRLKQIVIKWRAVEGSPTALFSAIARVWYWHQRASVSAQNMQQYMTALIAVSYWHKRVENFAEVSDQVFEALAHVIRASSAVECINSILRPYESIKKHLNQNFLALIALYWNMHPLPQRGGVTPFEESGINLGTKDWLELLQIQMRRMKISKQVA